VLLNWERREVGEVARPAVRHIDGVEVARRFKPEGQLADV
jgi:hypothetical protein